MKRRQKAARRHYRPEEILAKLREAEVLLGQGMKVPDVVRELGIHEITYYRWRKEYGGMRINQMKRLKELETENSRLPGEDLNWLLLSDEESFDFLSTRPRESPKFVH
ncbi:transposase, partial [Candidatus Bipolaricaulota bacterium]